MSARKAHLIERLKANRDEVIAFFEAVKDDQWQDLVYMDGAEWPVLEVICHYAEVERWYHSYIQKRLKEPARPTDSGFLNVVLDPENVTDLRACDYDTMGPKELIASFKEARNAMIKLTEGLAEEQLDHPVHWQLLADIGVKNTVEEMLLHLLRHLDRHQDFVQAAVSGKGTFLSSS